MVPVTHLAQTLVFCWLVECHDGVQTVSVSGWCADCINFRVVCVRCRFHGRRDGAEGGRKAATGLPSGAEGSPVRTPRKRQPRSRPCRAKWP